MDHGQFLIAYIMGTQGTSGFGELLYSGIDPLKGLRVHAC